MWMAVLWDFASGTYALGQDWKYSERWEADLVKRAKLCVKGLQDMKTFKAQQRASSVQHPVSAPSPAKELEDFMLAFMTAWCSRVSDGIMAHGPLLAHARQCGHDLVKTSSKQPDGSRAVPRPVEALAKLEPVRLARAWT